MAKALTVGNKVKRVTPVDYRALGITAFDSNNDYPQRVARTLQRSPTGNAATNLYSTFLTGKGFTKPELNKLIVNSKKQSLADIAKRVNQDFATYHGCAFHINYNALLQPISINHVPFEMARLATEVDGKVKQIAVHPDWLGERRTGVKMRGVVKDDIKFIDIYTEDQAEIQLQIDAAGGFEKWNGHIVYYTVTGCVEYVLAPCDPVFEVVETEYGINIFSWRTTKKGYMPGGILAVPGKTEGPVKDGPVNENKTDSDQELTNTINENQGAENSGNIIVIPYENPEQLPQFTSFEIKNTDSLFEKTDARSQKTIARNYGQPKILHGIDTPGSLGFAKEWEDAERNYDQRCATMRSQLGKIYMPVLNKWQEPINVTEADMEVLPMTNIGKKNYLEMQAEISSCLTSAMTPLAKRGFLKNVLEVDEDTINELVPLETTTQPNA